LWLPGNNVRASERQGQHECRDDDGKLLERQFLYCRNRLVDGTLNAAGTVSLNRSGVVYFDPPAPGAEFPVNELGMIKYRYRLTWSATLSGIVLVDVFQGINAPRKINGGYKFPAMFQNRPLLCGYIAGKEGNGWIMG